MKPTRFETRCVLSIRRIPWAYYGALDSLEKTAEFISPSNVEHWPSPTTFHVFVTILGDYYGEVLRHHTLLSKDEERRTKLWDVQKLAEDLYDAYVRLDWWVDQLTKCAKPDSPATPQYVEHLNRRREAERALDVWWGFRKREEFSVLRKFSMEQRGFLANAAEA